MKSWEVMKQGGRWGLFIRDYVCQGVNPDYYKIKDISEEFAIELVMDNLAGDLYGHVDDALKKTASQGGEGRDG